MIQLGDQIRLAEQDRARLRILCGGREPGPIRTVAEYNAFIDEQMGLMPVATAADRLAKWLLGDLRISDARRTSALNPARVA